jgi:hypothetical protein
LTRDIQQFGNLSRTDNPSRRLEHLLPKRKPSKLRGDNRILSC